MEVNDKTFSDVLRAVRWFVRPPLDAEDIAGDIILEALEKKYERVSYSHIRSRCFDALRRVRLEAACESNEIPYNEDWRTDRGAGKSQAESQEIADLIQRAALSPTEAEALYHRFWRNETLSELAISLNVRTYEARDILSEAIAKLKAAAGRERS